MRTPLFLSKLSFWLLEESFIIHCIPEVHVHFHDFKHLFGLQAKTIIINIFCQLLTIYQNNGRRSIQTIHKVYCSLR